MVHCKYFETQLTSFSSNNIPIIHLCDEDAYIRGDLDEEKQPFSLTFDTGFVELYTLCCPLLKKYGFRSDTTVIRTEGIHDRRVQRMNWD